MADDYDELIEIEEPDDDISEFDQPENIWMHGLLVLVFGFFFSLAEKILWVVALIQFLWMLFAKEKNSLLVEFGRDLGKWMQDVARFQSGVSDAKPFPWKKWG